MAKSALVKTTEMAKRRRRNIRKKAKRELSSYNEQSKKSESRQIQKIIHNKNLSPRQKDIQKQKIRNAYRSQRARKKAAIINHKESALLAERLRLTAERERIKKAARTLAKREKTTVKKQLKKSPKKLREVFKSPSPLPKTRPNKKDFLAVASARRIGRGLDYVATDYDGLAELYRAAVKIRHDGVQMVSHYQLYVTYRLIIEGFPSEDRTQALFSNAIGADRPFLSDAAFFHAREKLKELLLSQYKVRSIEWLYYTIHFTIKTDFVAKVA